MAEGSGTEGLLENLAKWEQNVFIAFFFCDITFPAADKESSR